MKSFVLERFINVIIFVRYVPHVRTANDEEKEKSVK